MAPGSQLKRQQMHHGREQRKKNPEDNFESAQRETETGSKMFCGRKTLGATQEENGCCEESMMRQGEKDKEG